MLKFDVILFLQLHFSAITYTMNNLSYYLFFSIFFKVNFLVCDGSEAFTTQTVYGFLDFTTTIGNTVMVFSPQSAPLLDLKANSDIKVNIIETKPIVATSYDSELVIQPTKLTVSVKEFGNKTDAVINVKRTNIELSNDLSTKKSTKPTLHIENNINFHEYNLLSREPVEYAEEAFRLVNIKTTSLISNRHTTTPKSLIAVSESGKHPIGLVTKLRETELNEGITTTHETSVIGTYISGKYAQILQSTVHVHKKKKPKIKPSSSLRVLKTTSPSLPIRSSQRQSISNIRNRSTSYVYNSNSSRSDNTTDSEQELMTDNKNRNLKKSHTRSKSKRRSGNHHSSDTRKSSPSATLDRKSFRSKIQSTSTEADISTSVYMFKLNRVPGRWQYKSSPKPRVTIRKFNDNIQSVSIMDLNTSLTSIKENKLSDNLNQNIIQADLESAGAQNGAVLNNVNQENSEKMFVETLNIEISTPANFQETYYEIATIKMPYSFQVGSSKKMRFITVTSTYTKVLKPESSTTLTNNEPLTENILQSSQKEFLLDGSVTTLMTIHLTNDNETPSLETITESYTFTQKKLQTQILPIVRHNLNETSYHTLVQTFDFTSFITATKTLSPLDANQFVPSKNFKDFEAYLDEAGSEINLELEFGDEDNSGHNYLQVSPNKSSIDNSSYKKNPSITLPVPRKELTSDQINQLALLNAFIPSSQILSNSKNLRPEIKLETLWETYVIPIMNGISTNYRTVSKSIGVIEKTNYIFDSTSLPLPLIPPSVNPLLLPINPPFQTITTSIVQPTNIIQTKSKVLKLTFGAKTAYTTLYSTEVVPTALTMFITTSLPVQNTAAFPGYYPPPYPPYAYVG